MIYSTKRENRGETIGTLHGMAVTMAAKSGKQLKVAVECANNAATVYRVPIVRYQAAPTEIKSRKAELELEKKKECQVQTILDFDLQERYYKATEGRRSLEIISVDQHGMRIGSYGGGKGREARHLEAEEAKQEFRRRARAAGMIRNLAEPCEPLNRAEPGNEPLNRDEHGNPPADNNQEAGVNTGSSLAN